MSSCKKEFVPCGILPIVTRLDEMGCSQENIALELKIIRQSLTSQFPLVAKVEYPEVIDGNRIVYELKDISFRDYVLGPLNIYFSGRLPNLLPIFIKDISGFEHTVNASGGVTQLIGVSLAQVNVLIGATYSGNIIQLL